MRYGLGYKGSKSRIADRLALAIPDRGIDNFYDLFAGGCAMTHKMMLCGSFNRYYANDYDGRALHLFADAIDGKYRDEKRWISRDDFFRLRDTVPYVAVCWSFGNNQKDYIYSRKIEPYKKACHYAIVLDDFALLKELCPEVADTCEEALRGVADTHERRIKFGPAIVNWLKAHGTAEMLENNPLYSSCHTKKDTKTRPKGTIRSLQSLQRLQSLQSLESLQSLQSLESLESLERLETSFVDYREVEIKPRSIIYCDPPYKGTSGYVVNSKAGFDYAAFYDWCCQQEELVLVSEYAMPEDRFTAVWSTKHIQTISSVKTSSVTEKLFVPTRQLEKYREMMLQSHGKPKERPRYVEQSLFDFGVQEEWERKVSNG